jgi:hypothetical protein
MSETEINFVEFYFSYNEVETGLIKALLEGEGIPALVRDMHITPYPISIGKFAEKRIAVPEEMVEDAKELIKQAIYDGFLNEREGKFKE